MRVHDLIEELKKCPPDGEVWTEGCDCTGKSALLVVDPQGNVLIARPECAGGQAVYEATHPGWDADGYEGEEFHEWYDKYENDHPPLRRLP